MSNIWLISKHDSEASAYKVAEQDVEGYVNTLRNKGIGEFEIASPQYGINDFGRYEITNPEEDVPEFGSYAAHQPGYDKFKEQGMLDDYVHQSLVHMGHASHQLSWGLTVLGHVDIPKELKEEIRAVVTAIPKLQEKLREFKNC
ncbi:hypothetical protein ASD24_24515 [Paenibacillus sp. Root52]|uniref:hypothetical protein n=1 Tax=Paenibacillus sp. Root52 TaxID=1736552 RepID=UPI0006F65B30|nr:hypothetical protein [Paenibacillus sp. Root52]KQY90963.1 hypothetical protein ASD24_24515 [Paenibacillus sp. Root52]